MTISTKELSSILNSEVRDPHSILGLHPIKIGGKQQLVARVFIKDAQTCELIDCSTKSENRYPLEKISEEGFFEGIIPNKSKVFKYRLRVVQFNEEIRQFYDPYAFEATLGDQDVYLFNQGTEHRIYEKLGSHLRKIDNIPGTSFAVWAPSAKRVSLVGDFNGWDGRYHPMRMIGSSGIWEIFVPGLTEGTHYKYEIHGEDNHLHLKTDPYASYFESPPHNASIVYSSANYKWNDDKWISKRSKTKWKEKPLSVYEIHVDSWKRKADDGDRPLTYRELATELVDYVKDMGYTHVEFMPLAEHPFTGSWGYQVTGLFAPTHRYGTPEDFKFLVDALHAENIGVLIDWVPGHFPKDSFALSWFDGSHLYEHSDPRQGEHQDWGTLIFNYGRHEVKCFLIASALAWFENFHIDGLRVDAVASMLYLDYSREEGEWIPNQYGGNENLEAIDFLREVNNLVHDYYPGALMIAEESTSFGGVSKPTSEGGLGFDFKWNMGWMNDTLEYFKRDTVFRKWHHNELTFGMIYQYSENFVQVFSHDEVVHGKGSMLLKMAAGDISEKANCLRGLYGLMWGWPGKKTMFMGSDFGQSSEWEYDKTLDWHLLEYLDHSGIQHVLKDLNSLYCNEPAFHESDLKPEGFEWRSMDDSENSIISFLRKDSKSKKHFIVVGNYTPTVHHEYPINVPLKGFWKEVINTDAAVYGGSGEGNMGGKNTAESTWDNHEHTLLLTLPGNSTSIFEFIPEKKKVAKKATKKTAKKKSK